MMSRVTSTIKAVLVIWEREFNELTVLKGMTMLKVEEAI